MSAFSSEIELAAHVVSWLRKAGWDVHQEVHGGWGIADIVAQKDGVTWIVECKRSLTFAVMHQAMRWIDSGSAHHVSVAVPDTQHGDDARQFALRVAQHFGIGVIAVQGWAVASRLSCYTTEPVKPKALTPDSKYHGEILAGCNDHTATETMAGSAPRPTWTAFKAWCQDVSCYVASRPEGWCTIRSAAAACSAVESPYWDEKAMRRNLLSYVQTGDIPGVRAVADTRGRPAKYILVHDPSVQGKVRIDPALDGYKPSPFQRLAA